MAPSGTTPDSKAVAGNKNLGMVKILILSNNAKEAIVNASNIDACIAEQKSVAIQTRLTQLKTALTSQKINYQITISNEVVVDAKMADLAKTSAIIKAEHYDIVLMGQDTQLPCWKLIDACSENPNDRPVFYLAGTVDGILDKELKHLQFSGAIEIVKEGDAKPLVRAAYRDANRWSDAKTKNTPETQFNIGSVTKMLTATAVAIMAKKYGLDYHKPISDFIPANYPYKEIFKDFTLHELLTHTSGLGRGGSVEAVLKTAMIKFEQLQQYLPWLKQPGLLDDKELPERRKAKQVSYSNPGYFFLGLAIEAITNQTYYAYITEQVLKPAGMPNTAPKRNNPQQPIALAYPKKPVLDFKAEGEWLKKMLAEEKNVDLKKFASQVHEFLQVTQAHVDEFYPKIEALIKSYEQGLATIKTQNEFVAFREKLIKELGIVYSAIEKDKPKIDKLKKDIENKDGELIEWIKSHQSNPELLKNATRLSALLDRDALYSHLWWASQVVEGIIINFSIAHPAGCWYSTVDDLQAFAKALFTKQEMLAEYRTTLIQPGLVQGYGRGFVVRREEGMAAIGHTGGAPGVSAGCFTYPAQGFTMVVLANDDALSFPDIANPLERNLICASSHGIQYFDPRINPNAEQSLTQDIHQAIYKNEYQLLAEKLVEVMQSSNTESMKMFAAELLGDLERINNDQKLAPDAKRSEIRKIVGRVLEEKTMAGTFLFRNMDNVKKQFDSHEAIQATLVQGPKL